MRRLSPVLAKIAAEQLNETPARIAQDLIILRVWLSQQSHLSARTSDEFLIAFLRYCRYSLEATKQRIENFFTYFNYLPELFGNRCVNQRMLDINRMGIHYYPEIPKSDDESALLIARVAVYSPDMYNLREIMRFVSMAVEIIALESDNASVAGVTEIADFTGLTLEKMNQSHNDAIRKFWEWLLFCCPLRIKRIYIINVPKEMQWVMKIFRSFTPKRLEGYAEVIVLKSNEQICDYIPKKCLPEEYGGTNGHMKECIAYMEDTLKTYRAYFEDEINYGVCEKLRIGEVAHYEAEFGVNGTFRKLNLE